MIPKIRVWNYKKKEMSYNVLAIDFVNKWVEVDYPMYPIKYSFNDIESMLPTGIRDKNGKFIFEGDIVKNYNWDNGVSLSEVYFWHDECCFEVGRLSDKFHLRYTLNECLANHFLEVVGNIYENPELLKEVKQ